MPATRRCARPGWCAARRCSSRWGSIGTGGGRSWRWNSPTGKAAPPGRTSCSACASAACLGAAPPPLPPGDRAQADGLEFVVADDHAGLRAAIREVLPEAAFQRCYVHTIRTQSTVRLVGRSVPAGRWAAQRDDVADLQAALVDDDALDDELQDDLLVGKARLLEAAADPVVKGGEIVQHRPRLDLLAA